MTTQTPPKNTLELLREPLPPEAVKPHPTKSYLSQINSIYVVDRLNDVFGLGGWSVSTTIVEVIEAGTREVLRRDGPKTEWHETMVVLKMQFTATDPETNKIILIEAYGGNDNDDRGDAYKGAATDALTKIGSYLGIGSHVWKDKKTSAPAAPKTAASSEVPATPPPAAEGIRWINKGAAAWDRLVVHLAATLKPASQDKLDAALKDLRTNSAVGIATKDKAVLLEQVLRKRSEVKS